MPETAIALGTTATDLEELDNVQFLRSVVWRKSADRKLATAAQQGDVASFCRALRTTFGKRRVNTSKSRSTANWLPQLLQPLWSQHAWDDAATSSALSTVLIGLQRRFDKQPAGVSGKASRFVQTGLEAAPLEASPWAQIAWLTVLVSAGDLLEDDALMRLWRESLASVVLQMSSTPGEPADSGDFADDRQLLMTGELPWLAGLAFVDVKGAAKVRQHGQSELRTQLEATTDSDGMPHARSLHRLPLTLGVFARSVSVGRLLDVKLLNRAAADRFQQLVTRAAVMAHADGRLALSNGSSFAPGSLLRTASALTGVVSRNPLGRRLRRLPDDAPTFKGRGRKPIDRLPKVKRVRSRPENESPSSQSDWAELTCMRNNWSEGGDSCIIAHHGRVPQLSVTAFERQLIDGDWPLSIEVNGDPVALTADWSCVCWFSDDDADYVELEQEIDGGLKLLRQVLLSRTDHWLLLADNARLQQNADGDAPALKLTSRLPLTADVTTEQNRWTRDLRMRAKKLNVAAYPLGLPQDRVNKADGSLTTTDGQLVLEQTSANGGLHMPLVIDWSPDRQRDESCWRQLTIAEDGRRLPPHIACGHRLQIGRHQWLFYRSHQPGETGRTVLGHHTPHETVIAEFTSSGEVEPIVMVE